MSTPTLLLSLFKYKAWANGELFAELTPEQLPERIKFQFTDGAAGCMSREEMLAHVVTHGGYHRGAVGRIMAQAGVPPPRDIFTVFLHQAEPQRREHTVPS